MTVTLRLKKEPRLPIDAKCISPDVFAGKSLEEIGKLQLWEGNRQRILADIFEIEGTCGKTAGEVVIHLFGDLSKVRRVGERMTDGVIKIQGNVGMHLGEEMRGGIITVEGDAGSWTGSALRGGTIEVKKDAGDYVGGTYRGGTKGMKGGKIVIHGSAGTEVGCYMRKGLIEIHGDVEEFVGIRMKDGTIVVHGSAGERAGAFMTGGKIILCGHMESVLPTFTIDSIKNKAKVEENEIKGPFYLFVGDLAENGDGKLYVSKDRNEQLKDYGELL